MTSKKQPTARTLEALRKKGWPCQTVEKWIQMRGGEFEQARDQQLANLKAVAESLARITCEPSRMALNSAAGTILDAIGILSATPPGVRKDLFGIMDIIALDGQPGCLGIQACAGASVSARASKAKAEPLLRDWLAASNRFQVWGWRETLVPTGAKTKAVRWRPRILELYLDGAEIGQREIEDGNPASKARAISSDPGPVTEPAPGLFPEMGDPL